jgi:hypothetical protein
MNLDTLKRLAEKATDGPWEHLHIYAGEEVIRAFLDRPDAPVIGRFRTEADGAFIVALVNAFPALIARLEAAEAVCMEVLPDHSEESSESDCSLCRKVWAWHSLTAGKEREE